MRAFRIAIITLGLPLLFALSQRVSQARGHEAIPGISWALGVVAALLLVRALVTEWARGPESNLQKDLLWGLSAGALATILWRWWGA